MTRLLLTQLNSLVPRVSIEAAEGLADAGDLILEHVDAIDMIVEALTRDVVAGSREWSNAVDCLLRFASNSAAPVTHHALARAVLERLAGNGPDWSGSDDMVSVLAALFKQMSGKKNVLVAAAIAAQLDSTQQSTRTAAIAAVGNFGDMAKDHVNKLVAFLASDDDAGVAARALKLIHPRFIRPHLGILFRVTEKNLTGSSFNCLRIGAAGCNVQVTGWLSKAHRSIKQTSGITQPFSSRPLFTFKTQGQVPIYPTFSGLSCTIPLFLCIFLFWSRSMK